MSPSSESRDPEGTTLIPHLACASVMTNQSQRVGCRRAGNDLRASVSHTGSVLTTTITPPLPNTGRPPHFHWSSHSNS